MSFHLAMFMQSRLHNKPNKNFLSPEKLLFLDIIIEDDAGEVEEKEEVVPYQLTKEALILDMKVQDIKVCIV